MDLSTAKEGRNTATISYITLIGTVIAIFMNQENKNQFASFHIRQALGVNLLWIILVPLVSGFNSWMISFSFWIFCFILWGYGFMGALQERRLLVPFVGPYFQKWFNKIG